MAKSIFGWGYPDSPEKKKKKSKHMSVRNNPNLHQAIHAVKTGKMKIAQAARSHKIHDASLRRYIKGEYKDIIKNNAPKSDPRSYLSGKHF